MSESKSSYSNFALGGTVCEIRHKVLSEDFVQEIVTAISERGLEPREGETNSWRESIPALLELLGDKSFDDLRILFEVSPSPNTYRIDAILLGGTIRNRRAIIIELKGSPLSSGVLNHRNPVRQVYTYRRYFELYHSQAAEYEFKGIVYLYSMNSLELQRLEQSLGSEYSHSISCYGEDDRDALREDIADFLLPTDISEKDLQSFGDANHIVTPELVEIIENKGLMMLGDISWAFGSIGIQLTDTQYQICSEIVDAITNNNKIDFIVQGGCGSGKTLVSIFLAFEALKKGLPVALCNQNKHLKTILQHVLGKVEPGLERLVQYYHSLAKDVARNGERFSVIVGDEAQRATLKAVSDILPRADITVLFIDERQKLRPDETGSVQGFMQLSESAGRTPVLLNLPGNLRCFGGLGYDSWIDTLLSKRAVPANLFFGKGTWNGPYDLHICESADELVERCRSHVSEHRKVGLVASWTESYGDNRDKRGRDNRRIGYPLESGYSEYQSSELDIYWAMGEDYIDYWVDRGCSRLEQCATVYGAQGFEADYVGVVWGRDLVMRDGEWALDNAQHSYDKNKIRGNGLVHSSEGRNEWSPGAMQLLFNRYRIFLTRGARGTFIYSEDPETREFLLDCQM